jgi:hypothetical protein
VDSQRMYLQGKPEVENNFKKMETGLTTNSTVRNEP